MENEISVSCGTQIIIIYETFDQKSEETTSLVSNKRRRED
jgi:hypothetical protein